MLYKPTELHAFLETLGIRPKKGLSQNFLIDGNIIRNIVKAAHVAPGDVILEIGPGPGALTEALLIAGAHVIAVEKDPVLAYALERLQTPDNRLRVIQDDIMHVSAETLAQVIQGDIMHVSAETLAQVIQDDIMHVSAETILKPHLRAKIVANLPYHLTTPILERFIAQRQLFSLLVVMVQEEVARRLTAPPGNRTYGSLTVFLNYFSIPRYAFKVSNRCFYPVPKVDSALVILELKEPPQVADEGRFFIMTRTAFEHRRKMMRSSLRMLYPPEIVMKTLTELGKSPLARPEELSLEEFVAFFNKIERVL